MTLRRRRLLRNVLIAVPTLLALYAIVGFFGVPLLIRKVVLPRISESLNGEARVAEAACNPFLLSVTLGGLEVLDAEGARVVGCDRVYANLQIASIWRGGPHFREITLERPFVAAEVDPEGKVNLAQLVKPSPDEPDAEPGEPWRLSAERLELVAGRIEFRDRVPATPFEIIATPVDATFVDFDTDPANSNVHRFTAALVTGGDAGGEPAGTLAWEGDFFLDPLSSRGRIELSDLSLDQFRPYLEGMTEVELTRGVTGVTLGYRFAPLKSPQVAEVTLERYRLADLALSLGGEPLFSLREVMLEGVRADAVDRQLAADTLRVSGVRLRVERAADGTLTVVEARPDPSGARPAQPAAEGQDAAPEPQPAEAPPRSPIARVLDATLELLLQALNPWQVRVQTVQVEDAALQWSDLAAPEPVEIAIDDIRLEAGPILSDEGYRVPLTLGLRVAESGKVAVVGAVGLEARVAELELNVEALPLVPLGPYLKAGLPDPTLASGAFALGGRVTATAADPERPQLTFAGDLGIATLRIDTPAHDDLPLLAWDDLQLAGITFDHVAATAGVEQITLAGVAGAVARQASSEPADEEAPDPEPAQPPYTITVGELRVTSHDLVLTDTTVDPAGRLTLSGLDATIRNLVSTGDAPAEVELRGTLQDAATLTATGTVTPRVEAPGADLALRVAALPLPGFSGYTAEYVGFPVESGRLDTDVKLRLERHNLDAQVEILLERFHLGDRIEGADAPNVPIKLALGLLRDRSDRIDLTVPIAGDLSDPQVKVGHLVVQAILNTLVKIAASPFDFIAGAVTGGGEGEAVEDLDRLAFEPGSVAISEPAARKLDVLATALQDRPALSLVIRGGADPAADEAPLRGQMLRDRIRADLAATLPEDDPKRADPSQIEVSPEQYRYAVQRIAAQGAEDGPVAAEGLDLAIREPPPRRQIVRGGRVISRPVARPEPAPAPEPTDAPDADGGDAAAEGGPTFAEMEASALAAVPLPPDAVAQLADRRARAVQQYLAERGGVAAERLTLGPPAESDAGPAVRLELQ